MLVGYVKSYQIYDTTPQNGSGYGHVTHLNIVFLIIGIANAMDYKFGILVGRVRTICKKLDQTASVILCHGRVSTWSSSDEQQRNVPCFLQLVVVMSW